MNERLLTCTECSSKPLDVTIEDGEMIFSCENCGWQKIERNYFYLTAWEVEIRQALAPVDILEALLTDKDIVGFLRPRLKGVSHLSTFDPLGRFDPSGESLLGEVGSAYQVYLKNMWDTSHKKIVIIAGPNGAGKTTFAREFLPKEADCPDFVNAD